MLVQSYKQAYHETHTRSETSRCLGSSLARASLLTGQLRRRALHVCCKRDPLELEIWDSWQDTAEDWETEKFSEEELVDILFEVRMLHLPATLETLSL